MSDHETPPPIPQGPQETDPYQAPVSDVVPTYHPPAAVGQDANMRMLLPVGRSWMAIVAGYLGMLSIFLVVAPFAVLFGILGLNDIKRSEGSANPKHGKGRCWFGIVTGLLGTAGLIAIFVIAPLGQG